MRLLAACLLLALAVLGCATPNALVRKSSNALAQGDERKAWELAARALDKDPDHAGARAAAAVAAAQAVTDWRVRITNLATVDSISAARQCLELSEFTATVSRYGVPIPPDSAFALDQLDLLHDAAASFVLRGDADLRDGRPKRAYESYLEARRFDSGVVGLDQRTADAHAAAQATVAILPFQDATHVPGLALALADIHHHRIDAEPGFRFTEFVPLDEIEQRITLSELDHGGPDDLARAARDLGADFYVTGRLDGFRADTRSEAVHTLLFHPVARRDTSGRERIGYRSEPFDAIVREREVWVTWAFELRRASDAGLVTRRTGDVHLRARTFYTSFVADGDCDAYAFCPPEGHREDGFDADEASRRWNGWFSGWDVPDLLEYARNRHDRRRYSRKLEHEFARDTYDHPVYLDDLPPADDMARLGVTDTWRDVLAALVELDATDVEP